MQTKQLQPHLVYGIAGLVMGFVLTRIGFTDYGEAHKMLTFADLRMFLAFGGGVAIAMGVFLVLRGTWQKQRKFFHEGTFPGAVLFGAGWAISGACPAIAIVQVGQGYLPALLTMIGIFAGSVAYRYAHGRWFRWSTGGCE